MHCLKNFLCTCVLALITLSALHAQQRDQLYHQVRFHVVPGQERAFINANVPRCQHHRATTDRIWRTYVYSDHTIGVMAPIQDLTATESPQTGSGAADGAVPAGDQFKLRDPEEQDQILSGREERVLRYRADLSYAPGPAERTTTPPAYYEIVTYRTKPGQLDKLMEHYRQFPALMEAAGSPLAFSFYSYDRGGEPNGFEIAYPAEDAEGLAERRAAHAAFETAAMKDWCKTLAALADVEGKITGRYVAEMSRPGHPQ